MQQDVKNKKFRFSYDRFLLKFKSEFGGGYDGMKVGEFLSDIVSKVFNMKDYGVKLSCEF